MERQSIKGDDLAGQLVRTSDDTKRFKLFRISSVNRIRGTNYDFVCNFGNDVSFDKVLEIHLNQVVILNGFPNVSTSRANTTFLFTSTALGNLALVIPTGFYSTSQLMSTIQTALNTAIAATGTTFAITQDPITGKITWTRTAGADTIIIITNALSKLMGVMATTSAFSTYTATTVPALNGEPVVFIHSIALSPNLTYLGSSGNVSDTNCAFTIPVNVPYGTYMSYVGDADIDRIVYGSVGKRIAEVDIRLRGINNVLLDTLPPNSEVVIVLKVFYA